MSREAQIERDEFIRLEKQDELEREIMDLKRRLDDLGLLVQEEE